MKTVLIFGFIALLGGNVLAEEPPQNYTNWYSTTMREYPLIVYDAGKIENAAVELVTMEPGSCLRGPLTIRHITGDVAFSLEAGVDYPAGCSKGLGY